MAVLLAIQPGQQRTLTVVAAVAGIDPSRVTAAVWTPKGTDQNVRWIPPDAVEGVALGYRDFSVRLTLAAVPGGAAEEITYPFVIGCMTGEPTPVLPVMFIPKQESVVTPPPVISNVVVVAITATTAAVDCDTSTPAEVRVEYGSGFAIVTAWGIPAVVEHTTPLTGLAPQTTITYRVRARDALAQETVSPQGQFVTLALPDTTAPTLTNITAVSITSSSATIQTQANEPAQIRVEYGASFGTVTAWSAGYVAAPVVSLGGLAPSTLITYRVRARDASGNESVSGSQSFTTLAQVAAGSWSIASDSDSTIMTTYDKSQDAAVLGNNHIWGDGNPGRAITESWNSGAYDPVRNRMYCWGAGHNDGAYNGVLAFDFATRRWFNLTLPSTQWIRKPGTGHPLSGPANSAFSDGTPTPTHTYDTQEVIGDEYLVTFGGSRWHDAERGFYGWFLNLTTLTWRTIRTDGGDGSRVIGDLGRNGDWDPIRQRIIMREEVGQYVAIDIQTGVKTKPWPDDYHSRGWYDGYTSCINHAARRMYTIGKRDAADPGTCLELNLDGTGPGILLTPADFGTTAAVANELFNSPFPAVAYDSRRQIIVCWRGGGDVYEFNGPARTVVKVAGASTGPGTVPPAMDVAGVMKRWRYRPGPDDFVLVHRATEPVYLYKAPTGTGGTPEPPPPTTLTVTPSQARGTDTLTATWTEITNPHYGDWLGFYPRGAPSDEASRLGYVYLNGSSTSWPTTPIPGPASCPLPLPNLAVGLYDVRLFRHSQPPPFTLLAQDEIEVLPPLPTGIAPFVITAHPKSTHYWSVAGHNDAADTKHTHIAYRPVDDKFYFIGGDWGATSPAPDPGSGSGNTTTWTYHAPTDTWERIYPPGPQTHTVRCGPAGDIQPSQPDEVCWAYDAHNDLFHAIEGYWAVDQAVWRTTYCPGQADAYRHEAMTFNPVTRKYALTYLQRHPSGSWGSDNDCKYMIYDAFKKELIRFHSGPACEYWDVVTGAFRSVPIPLSAFVEQDQMAWVPTQRTAWAIDYGPSKRRLISFNVDTHAARVFPVPAGYVWGEDFIGRGDYNKSNLVYDEIRRVLVLLNIGDLLNATVWNFYTFDPVLETWASHPQYLDVPTTTTLAATSEAVEPLDPYSGEIRRGRPHRMPPSSGDPQVDRIALRGRHGAPEMGTPEVTPRAGTVRLHGNMMCYGNGVIFFGGYAQEGTAIVKHYFTIR
jgi:hypothetical protein